MDTCPLDIILSIERIVSDTQLLISATKRMRDGEQVQVSGQLRP